MAYFHPLIAGRNKTQDGSGCADCDAYVYLDNTDTPFVAVNTIHSDTCPALTEKRARLITSTERFEGENNE